MSDTATCYNNSPTYNQSTTSNYSLYLLNGLSSTAKYLYIEMRRIAGVKGYMSCPASHFNDITGRSTKQTRRLLYELKNNNLIDIWLHPGCESEYIIQDVYSRQSMDTNVHTFKNKSLKKNQRFGRTQPNVILNFPEQASPATHSEYGPPEQIIETKPPSTLATDNKIVTNFIQPHNAEPTKTVLHQQQKPIKLPSNVVDMSLVQQILEVTGDKKSTACFIKIVKNVPEAIVYAAISSLKLSMDEGIVSKPGAYFVSTIKNYCPDLFNSKTATETLLTQQKHTVASPKAFMEQCFEPEETIVPASQEIVKESMDKIKLILNKPRYVLS